ncbi:hypothetical protein tb265_18640 [Gemmatimonadetes bacterium T265]|nr:hypothetical protein tb265_18640 [Gemmatimonadetes bacterium T265]
MADSFSDDAPPPPPSVVPGAELMVARAVARRSGRPVFAVRDPATGTRRLAGEPPEDVRDLAYLIDRRGGVRYGPAGRADAPAAGASLVRDASRIPAAELAVARDVALAAGATVFVGDPPVSSFDALDDEDDEDETVLLADQGGPAFRFEPPADGTLRYAVRPWGELVVGDDARREPPRGVNDPGWTPRVSAILRTLRRFRERGASLATLGAVDARAWGRVERLVPEAERKTLRPGVVVGRPGREVAAAVEAAAEREVARLRAEARRRVRD